jgi:limonene-1,2-epoxide hydrolase
MTSSPKEVARALVDSYNAKSLDGVLELYRPDGRYWDPLHTHGVAGRDALRELLTDLFAASVDEQMQIVTLAGDERYAVAELRSGGTYAATGVRFELDLTEVYEIVEGRIASCRAYFDPKQLPRDTRGDGVAQPARDGSAPGTSTEGGRE